MKDLVIIGTGGFALEVIDIIDAINIVKPTYKVVGLLDDFKNEFVLFDYPIIGTTKDIKQYKSYEFVVAIANPAIRKQIFNLLKQEKIATPNLIHPLSELSKHIFIKDDSGIIINYAVQISAKAQIKESVIIDSYSYVGHESIIHSFVTLYPNVKISGNTKIFDGTEIGLGTNIIQGISIGSKTLIGAGSTVVDDIGHNVIAVGSPCRPIKERLNEK